MDKAVIHIGSDHAGFTLKQSIKAHLEGSGLTVHDHGTHSLESTDYPDYAQQVCRAVLETGEGSCGILVCGTGIGMNIAANRFRGIRAALCTCEFHARLTREHNDANVLCLGSRVTGEGVAMDVVDIFLQTRFSGGRHQKRIDLIERT